MAKLAKLNFLLLLLIVLINSRVYEAHEALDYDINELSKSPLNSRSMSVTTAVAMKEHGSRDISSGRDTKPELSPRSHVDETRMKKLDDEYTPRRVEALGKDLARELNGGDTKSIFFGPLNVQDSASEQDDKE